MSRITRYLDKLEEDRCEITKKALRDRYYILLNLSGIDVDLSRKNRYWSLSLVLFNYMFMVIMTINLIYTAFLLREDFDMVSGQMNYAFLIILGLSYLIVSQGKRKTLLELHRRLGCGTFQYTQAHKENDDMRTFRKNLELQKRVLVYLAVFVLVTLVFIIVGPLIDNTMGLGYPTMFDENRINRQISVPLYLPLNVSNELSYIIGTACIACTGFATTTTLGGAGLILFMTAHSILLEQKILCCSVNAAPKRALNLYGIRNKNHKKTLNQRSLFKNKLYQNCLYECLTENVEHHRQIKTLMEMYHEVCSLPVYLTLMIFTVTIALSMVKLSEGVSKVGSSMAFAATTFAEFMHVLIIGYYGESLITMSEELSWEVYSLPWYDFNQKNKKFLMLFNMGNYKPICFVAWIIRLDMEVITNVLNAAYSFFNFLQIGKVREHQPELHG